MGRSVKMLRFLAGRGKWRRIEWQWLGCFESGSIFRPQLGPERYRACLPVWRSEYAEHPIEAAREWVDEGDERGISPGEDDWWSHESRQGQSTYMLVSLCCAEETPAVQSITNSTILPRAQCRRGSRKPRSSHAAFAAVRLRPGGRPEFQATCFLPNEE